MRLPSALLLLLLGLGTALGLWYRTERAGGSDFLIFDEEGAASAVILPDQPTPEERQAAQLVAETLAAAAGVHSLRFPIKRERDWRLGQRGIFIGATKREAGLYRLAGSSALERPVAASVGPEGVVLRARWPEDIGAAASWFLEEQVGARWFIPGPWGREVQRRPALRLPYGEAVARPGYLSRDLGGVAGTPEGEAWARANRLRALFPFGHTAAQVATTERGELPPEFAPWLEGARFVPPPDGPVNWQPDLNSARLAEHVTERFRRAFRAEPGRLAEAFGLNDTSRFDQSPATLAAAAPHRFFRGRPDYADVLFGFLNRVAGPLAEEFPDRFITTYAYDWTENTPRFHVAPMILPLLTADRSQWLDPAFAAEDRALIRRWSRAGPRLFGLYDYYYGAPFFVPRPTLHAPMEAIPYAFGEGARVFYAESTPNWGLDGPKLWLAAQLLWNPRQAPATLLAEYYRRYWREAAGPMRQFFERCDRQWREQPRPTRWIKYLKDDDQRRLFPPEVRAELHALLQRAARQAGTPAVRHRVRLAQEAFAVTEAFCRHDERREELARRARAPAAPRGELVRAWNRYSAARDELRLVHERVRRTHPLALGSELLGDYLRHDPRRRVVWALAGRGSLAGLGEPALRSLFAGRRPQPAEFTGRAVPVTGDPALATVALRDGHPFTLLEWTTADGAWVGKGAPCATRRIELRPATGGGQVLRFAGCEEESLFQWARPEPAGLYLATVRVRARVSPGNMTFLLVAFADAEGRHMGLGHTDRLPAGDWSEGTTLQVLVRAPRSAAHVGVGVRTLGQVNDDFAEFEALTLERLE